MNTRKDAGTPAVADEIGDPSGTDDAPIRSDARRNLARVLTAAEQLFAEEGAAVTMEAVAKRAGVGVGTIYRRFPTKAALGEAIIVDRLGHLATELLEIAATTPPERAFDDAITRIVTVTASRQDLKAALLNVGVDLHDVATPVMGEIEGIVGDLLVRAQAAGAIRLDVTTGEIVSLIGGACSACTGNDTLPMHLVKIIIDGLHALPTPR